jgi:uncharacterized protein (DUF488 family)
MTPEQLQRLRAYHHQQEGYKPIPFPLDGHTFGSFETIGYTESDAAQRIAAFMQQPTAFLIDIRFSPRSRLWVWNKSALQAIYCPAGDHLSRYVHLKELGNVNFKDPKLPIVLYQPAIPVQVLAEALSAGCSFLLLCACKKKETCHRKVVEELVLAKLAELPEMKQRSKAALGGFVA